jgi:hypothetical protein
MISMAVRRQWLFVVALLLPVVASPRPAVAQAPASDQYTATVTVDATSDTVAKARDVARVDGAHHALDALVAKLAGGPDKTKPLKLNDNQVTDMVASFEVANEKMSAVRYIADYTYHFRPADVKRVMQSAGITIAPDSSANSNNAAASTGASTTPNPNNKPTIVLPIYQDGMTSVLWDDPNPWRDAWAQRPVAAGGPSLVVPLGDASDLAAIDGEKARTGDSTALAAITKKESADEALVVLAAKRIGDKPGLDITARRYRAGQFVDVHFDAIDANPDEADIDLCRRAADLIYTDIATGWKNAKTNLADQQGSVVVVVPITSLDDWIKLRGRLTAVPSVRKLDVRSLSRQEATVEIQYVGSMDQLKANLAATKLGLEGGDPTWRLARSVADKP